MGVAGGAGIVTDGLVLSLDGASRRSTLKATQVNNILPDPGNWSTGTGGQSGYSPNGSSSEQNRVTVTDDPWGRTSITWRTTPDSTSGADGGWNSSYYTIDTNYTYRYSMWVRRYTSGTGGTFYMGMNPNPLRNDNDASQGNPYFTYPAISSLTLNQWYLVVAHVFYEGYTGGRHPESGWYENGVKISDKSFGNVGSSDVRWASGTTSAMHRSYHYYTTNVNSGIELAYPRVDKIDGKEPSISELINRGESGWLDLSGGNVGEIVNGLQYSSDGAQSSFNFDGTDDIIDTGLFSGRNPSTDPFTVEAILKSNTTSGNKMWVDATSNGSNQRFYSALDDDGSNPIGIQGAAWSDPIPSTTNYIHQTIVMDGSTARSYRNGSASYTRSYTSYTLPGSLKIGGRSGYNWNGEIPVFKVYDRALSAVEVQQNYNAYKNRFNL